MNEAAAVPLTPPPRPDPDLLRAFWNALVLPGAVHEVRIPRTRRGPARLWGVASGYFDDLDAFVDAVSSVAGADAEGVYLTLNAVQPALLARAHNRLVCGKPPTTSDGEVPRLRRFLLDFDPVRPAGIGATDAERERAIDARDAFRRFTKDELGWPHPLAVVESGNGGHLLYSIDLANDPEHVALLRQALRAAASLVGATDVVVDQTVYNPARVVRVYGSIAAKGDHTADRPWRVARARFNPAPRLITPEQLATLTALCPEADDPTPPRSLTAGAGQRAWDVRDVLRAGGVGYEERSHRGLTVFRLDRCLTSPNHVDGAAIVETAEGRLGYKCHHNSCSGKGWTEARVNLPVPRPAAPAETGPDGVDWSASPRREGSGRRQEEERRWPVLPPEALHGLVGEVVRAVDPHTEGDPAAILANTLVMFGSAVGLGPHLYAGDTRHGVNLFAAITGRTSRARKGSAHAGPFRVMGLADPPWSNDCQASGLGSGEGLIWRIRDPIVETNKKGERVVTDEGVADKRLLLVEEELSLPLKTSRREGSTVGDNLRKAWDARTLDNTVKGRPVKASNPHVAVLGHITQEELARVLDDTDMANGLANRFLWVCARRSKLLPNGGRMPDDVAAGLGRRLQRALAAARRVGEMRRDPAAAELWAAVYPELSVDRPGLVGAITARAEAQALRLQAVYALLDGTGTIGVAHVLAALAFWNYCEASARYVFGDRTGNPIADRILTALRQGGPLTETDISNLFARNARASQIDLALETLLGSGLVAFGRRETGGRPATLWRAT